MKFNTLGDFSDICGVGVHVIDRDGTEQFSTPAYREAQPCLNYVAKLLGMEEKCRRAMAYGGDLANRFGGRYVFLCPRKFVFFASPILLQGAHHLTAVGGPVLMRSHEDYIDIELEHFGAAIDPEILSDKLSTVPVFPAPTVNMLSEQLFVNTVHLSDNVRTEPTEMDADRLQEYLDSYPNENRGRDFVAIRQLVNTLAVLENLPAKTLLNEILGHILFHSGKNIEFVKIRVIELIGILSNTAIRDGADVKAVSELTFSYSKKIYEIDCIEDIVLWLNGILEEFSVFSLKNPTGRHTAALCDTIHYINRNYNRNLRLQDLAKRIYISPAHFSTLFKAETGYTFKEYLNKVRIEQSKALMQNAAINLADIAGMVGFSDQSYFTRVFKRQEGKPPHLYRCRLMGKNA
ncbi:MAG: helix-turn-helix domain-containing protein [Clostridiales Family XIII bacterium]|nr:helix-turn-helix domain-containing protein [Clostridiales Family XIII bacterium]